MVYGINRTGSYIPQSCAGKHYGIRKQKGLSAAYVLYRVVALELSNDQGKHDIQGGQASGIANVLALICVYAHYQYL